MGKYYSFNNVIQVLKELVQEHNAREDVEAIYVERSQIEELTQTYNLGLKLKVLIGGTNIEQSRIKTFHIHANGNFGYDNDDSLTDAKKYWGKQRNHVTTEEILAKLEEPVFNTAGYTVEQVKAAMYQIVKRSNKEAVYTSVEIFQDLTGISCREEFIKEVFGQDDESVKCIHIRENGSVGKGGLDTDESIKFWKEERTFAPRSVLLRELEKEPFREFKKEPFREFKKEPFVVAREDCGTKTFNAVCIKTTNPIDALIQEKRKKALDTLKQLGYSVESEDERDKFDL